MTIFKVLVTGFAALSLGACAGDALTTLDLGLAVGFVGLNVTVQAPQTYNYPAHSVCYQPLFPSTPTGCGYPNPGNNWGKGW